MDISREPVMTASAVAALLNVLVTYKVLDAGQAEAWRPLLLMLAPVLVGLIARRYVMPTATVRKAGEDPALLVERARQT